MHDIFVNEFGQNQLRFLERVSDGIDNTSFPDETNPCNMPPEGLVSIIFFLAKCGYDAISVYCGDAPGKIR